MSGSVFVIFVHKKSQRTDKRCRKVPAFSKFACVAGWDTEKDESDQMQTTRSGFLTERIFPFPFSIEQRAEDPQQ
jgi:hypothetical protein